MHKKSKSEQLFLSWKAELRAEVARDCAEGRWGMALMLIGWVHLVLFLICQSMVDPLVKRNPWHAACWAVDLLGIFVVMRLVAGKDWIRKSAATGVIVRVWTTFLIIAFNVVSLNNLMGWDHDWFKPVWCSLSSFGFAMMAWLLHRNFLIPAVQMYFTGLLMIRYPHYCYLLYGISWWSILQYVGRSLGRTRRPVRLDQGIGKSLKSKGTSVATVAMPK